MTYKDEYKRMFDRLNQLFAEGNGEGYESDVLRNEMDGPWYKMSEEDRIEMRKYSYAKDPIEKKSERIE